MYIYIYIHICFGAEIMVLHIQNVLYIFCLLKYNCWTELNTKNINELRLRLRSLIIEKCQYFNPAIFASYASGLKRKNILHKECSGGLIKIIYLGKGKSTSEKQFFVMKIPFELFQHYFLCLFFSFKIHCCACIKLGPRESSRKQTFSFRVFKL